MTPTPNFADHRRRVLEALQPDEAVLVFGSAHAVRNADTEYRYRAHSDVYWLSGWTMPDCAVFLRPGDEPFTLFVQRRDPELETWTGRRPGPEGAVARFGADTAHPISALPEKLADLLQGVSRLHYAIGEHPEHDAIVLGAIKASARKSRESAADVPETFHSPSVLLHELRLRKTEDEIAATEEAARLTAEGFAAVMSMAAPGVPEYRLEAAFEHKIRDGGGSGLAFNTIVAGGDNATILHYVENDDLLRDGELVLVDAGGEYSLYTADVSRTFPVNGRFSQAQALIYQAVLDAQEAAIAACRPGATHREVHLTAVTHLTRSMIALGLLEGDLDTLIAGQTYKRYYMHGTGHWLGLDVHDVGATSRGGRSRVLEPGMILTVEPGLYVPASDTTAPAALRGIGVRIEDDVLITADGRRVLTAAIPKEIAHLEAACAAPLSGTAR
ncbi:MAG: aminopeptidase P N-terminal domain-containing protein [Deltaproteobacteria bacterium]|nr:aminopeptidase P N-terminal domain-containing protein [Deltaproteobacteria bacterium]